MIKGSKEAIEWGQRMKQLKQAKKTQQGSGIQRKKQSWTRYLTDKALSPTVQIPFIENDRSKAASNMLYGYNDYTNKVFDFIKKHQYETIKKMEMWRTPVPEVISSILNMFSMGKFRNELNNKPYDKLFHLAAKITTDKGTVFILEKNEVINIDVRPIKQKETEALLISDNVNIRVIDLLNNTEKKMGSNYFSYNAKTNNCQDFQIAMLEANGLLNSNSQQWIKQDTESLFGKGSYLENIALGTTSFASRGRALIGTGSKRV